MDTNFIYSKMRCKKMHWMTENTIWEWWCTFTDCYSQLMPKYAVGITHGALSCNTLFIGSNDEANGPN